MSGVNIDGKQIRKGAYDAIEKLVTNCGMNFPPDIKQVVDSIAKSGGTPLVVSSDGQVLGAIELKDIVKGGIKERFVEMRKMGHQDSDDHWRQSDDCGRHCCRSWRG